MLGGAGSSHLSLPFALSQRFGAGKDAELNQVKRAPDTRCIWESVGLVCICIRICICVYVLPIVSQCIWEFMLHCHCH